MAVSPPLPEELRGYQAVAAATARPIVAAAYANGKVHVFELAEGSLRRLHTFQARAEGQPPPGPWDVPQVAFGDADGRILATRDGNRFRVWDLSAKPPRELAAGNALLFAASPISRLLAVRGAEGPELWDLASVPPRKVPNWVANPRFAAVDGLAFTPDGKQVVVCGGGKTELWSVAPGQEAPTSTAEGVSGQPAVSADGKVLFVMDGGIRQLRTFDGRAGGWNERPRQHLVLGAPIFSPNGRQLLTQPIHGLHTTSLWDLTGPAPVERPLPDSVRACRLLGWRGDALVMISGARLLTWKGEGEPELLADLAEAGKPSPGDPRSATLSSDGNWLAFVRDHSADPRTIEVCDLRANPPARTSFQTQSNPGRLRLAADGRRVLVGAMESPSRLYVREGAGWKEAWIGPQTTRDGAAISPAGDRVATITHYRAGVWDASALPSRLVGEVEIMSHPYTAELSPDGDLLAVAGAGEPGLITADARTTNPRKSWPVGSEFLAFAPDGRHLAVECRGCIWILRLQPAPPAGAP